MPRFYLLTSNNETIIPIRSAHYLVEVPNPGRSYSADELRNAPNTPGFAVQDMLPLLEEMEQIAGEGLPGFDECEAAGFDGTLRGDDGRPVGQPITWRQVAMNLINMQGPGMEPEISITRDFWETIGERLDEIEDEDDSLIETTFEVDGVRVKVE